MPGRKPFYSNLVLGKLQQADYMNTIRNDVSGLYQMIHSETPRNSTMGATEDTQDIVLQSPSQGKAVSYL